MDKAVANKFFSFLNKFEKLPLSEFEQHILPVLKTRHFDKKEYLSKSGEVENYLNFIIKGIVRKYYKKKNGHEIVIQIGYENHLILCHESFYSRQPSEYAIQTLEPTTVLSVRYDDLEKIFTASHQIEHLARVMITYAMILKDRWQMQGVKLTPRERFLHFVTKNPQVIQRVPQKYLASYLNIKPETFSRFKHLLRNPKDASSKSKTTQRPESSSQESRR